MNSSIFFTKRDNLNSYFWYLILMLYFLNGNAMRGQISYVIKDTAYKYGVTIIDNGNRINGEYCQIQAGKELQKYYPNEVLEYGFPDGRVYVAREVQFDETMKNVYLQRLVKGEVSLYFLKVKGEKLFFIQKDSATSIMLKRRNNGQEKYRYSSELDNYLGDFAPLKEYSHHITYDRKRLTQYVESYNNKKIRHIGIQRLGFMFGVDQCVLLTSPKNSNPYADLAFFKPNTEALLGAFYDRPIGNASSVLRLEFYGMKHGFAWKNTSMGANNIDYDMVINFVELRMPVLFKYYLPLHHVQPFVNAGADLSYLAFNRSEVLIFHTSSYLIENSGYSNSPVVSILQAGMVGGAGVKVMLWKLHSLELELRYSRQYGNSNLYSTGGIQFFTSYNIL